MPRFFFIVFIYLINFSCFLDYSSPSIINNYLSSDTKIEEEIKKYGKEIFSCVKENYSAHNKSIGYLISKCIIKGTKGNEKILRDFLKNINNYDEIINKLNNFISLFFGENEIMKLLINFFREKAKNESDFIDELYSLINHTDSKNQSLLDYVYR